MKIFKWIYNNFMWNRTGKYEYQCDYKFINGCFCVRAKDHLFKHKRYTDYKG